jgi:hypothetical protein
LKIEQRWAEVNAYGRQAAKRVGISEKDVVSLTKRVRKELARRRSTSKQPIR